MTEDSATILRARMEEVAAAAPEVHFSAGDLLTRGRRSRRRRARLAVGAVAATLALVVTVPVIALRAEPPATMTTAPTPSARTLVGGPIPGTSAAEAERIARACLASLAHQPGPAVDADDLALYNLIGDRLGRLALFYGTGAEFVCESSASGFRAAGGGEGTDTGLPDWLTGPVQVDHDGGSAARRTAQQVVGGRVSPAVSTLLVQAGDQSRRVPVVNGTFLARFLTAVDTPFSWQPASVRATAYDARGRVLGSFPGGKQTCFTAPDGSVVIGARTAGTRCVPATRWR
jgi:hypothetical protein